MSDSMDNEKIEIDIDQDGLPDIIIDTEEPTVTFKLRFYAFKKWVMRHCVTCLNAF